METAEYKDGRHCLISTNRFILPGMQPYSIAIDDDWNAVARHEAIETVLSEHSEWNLSVMKEALVSASSYDTATGHDTVWSVIEDMNAGQGYLCEGNPSENSYSKTEL